jgi:hypothetical protein
MKREMESWRVHLTDTYSLLWLLLDGNLCRGSLWKCKFLFENWDFFLIFLNFVYIFQNWDSNRYEFSQCPLNFGQFLWIFIKIFVFLNIFSKFECLISLFQSWIISFRKFELLIFLSQKIIWIFVLTKIQHNFFLYFTCQNINLMKRKKQLSLLLYTTKKLNVLKNYRYRMTRLFTYRVKTSFLIQKNRKNQFLLNFQHIIRMLLEDKSQFKKWQKVLGNEIWGKNHHGQENKIGWFCKYIYSTKSN